MAATRSWKCHAFKAKRFLLHMDGAASMCHVGPDEKGPVIPKILGDRSER